MKHLRRSRLPTSTFSCTARLADQLLSQSVPTFAYEFNDENASELFLPPVSFPLRRRPRLQSSSTCSR